ncbi:MULTISPECIES: cupin domain-containing protein [Sulfurimonas]|uniref:Cupin domain-containing protein n=1 Tax=Sulfurimonas diazotrophicus TaxID=3131939 RepID=A0ABZ3HE90_9BACT
MKTYTFLEAPRFGERVVVEKMLETPFSKEIRICMTKGSIMREHTAPGPITIMVLEGCVTLTSNGDAADLECGEMVCFDAHVPHSLEGRTKSVIRLTLSKGDALKRVIDLVKA